MARPRLLLLDEPSLGLAPLMVDRVFEVIRELKADGVPILLVEQLAERTVALADRTYVLQGGQLRACGTSETLERDVFHTAYLGSASAA
jgi:branched-chain amino acid transport system ATP-binding protein